MALRRRQFNDYLRVAQRELPLLKGIDQRHWTFILSPRLELLDWAANGRDLPGSVRRLGYTKEFHSTHSEVAAFRRAAGLIDLRRSPAFHAVNLRLNALGVLSSSSKPCSRCQAFLRAVGCGKVWFSTGVQQEFEVMVL